MSQQETAGNGYTTFHGVPLTHDNKSALFTVISRATPTEVIIPGRPIYAGQHYHTLRISLQSSTALTPFTYEPGYTFGIYPVNNPELVNELIQYLGDGNPEVIVNLPKAGEMKLRDALNLILDFDKPVSYEMVKVVRDKAIQEGKEGFASMLTLRINRFDEGKEDAFKRLGNPNQFLKWVSDNGVRLTAQEFINTKLREDKIRLYTIASSPLVLPDAVDLFIGEDRENVKVAGLGRIEMRGVTSHYVGSLQAGDQVRGAVTKSHYSMPENTEGYGFFVGAGAGLPGMTTFIDTLVHQGITNFTAVTGAHTDVAMGRVEQFREQAAAGVWTDENLHLHLSRQEKLTGSTQHRLDGIPGVRIGRVDFAAPMLSARMIEAWDKGYVRVCGGRDMAESFSKQLFAEIAAKEGYAPEIDMSKKNPYTQAVLARVKADKKAGINRDVKFDLF